MVRLILDNAINAKAVIIDIPVIKKSTAATSSQKRHALQLYL